MELEINGKNYTFIFGTRFVYELDKKYFFEREGIQISLALQSKIYPELKTGNPATLAEVLQLACKKPASLSLSDLFDYVDECSDIEQLFQQVLTELESSNAGKLALGKLKTELENQGN